MTSKVAYKRIHDKSREMQTQIRTMKSSNALILKKSPYHVFPGLVEGAFEESRQVIIEVPCVC